MYKLMLIEDDLQLSRLIQENLERYGYSVCQPENFTNIVEEFMRMNQDLVLLDLAGCLGILFLFAKKRNQRLSKTSLQSRFLSKFYVDRRTKGESNT